MMAKRISNTALGPGAKGSKYLIQETINSGLVTRLNKEIGLPNITWVSPLFVDNYREYKLNQPLFKDAMKKKKKKKNNVHQIVNANFDFWPKRQPQWDAIGFSGETLILVEAKAHTSEVNTKSEAGLESLNTIRTTFQEIIDHFSFTGNIDAWTSKYYQYANRLAFLYNLSKQNIPVRLIFLNFIDDSTYMPTSIQAWSANEQQIHNELFGQNATNFPGVQTINFKV